MSCIAADGAKVALQIENGGLGRLDLLDFLRPSGALVWYLNPQLLRLAAAAG